MDTGFLTVIILLVAICGGLAAIALLCRFILSAIKNKTAKKIVFVLMCIFLLPAILLGMSIDRITEKDLVMPFSWDVHVRSKGIVLSLIVYSVAYFILFDYLFK